MTELIKIILEKNEWQTKINNEEIVQTWRTEVIDQGISLQVFECTLDLLKSYKKSSENVYESMDDEFNWDVRLGVSVENDMEFQCDCRCACCQDGWNADDEEEEDFEEYDDEEKKARTMVCHCTDEVRIARHQRFLDKFVLTKTFDDARLKTGLLSQISTLENSITDVDYHPGSNNQVVDLVHPSLFCYVKGVTEIRNVDSLPAPTTDAVFQWLPSEFTVHRAADQTVERVSIDSYINNLSQETNPHLYESIAQIFDKLVPQFDTLCQH
jgi:hypothetical protein